MEEYLANDWLDLTRISEQLGGSIDVDAFGDLYTGFGYSWSVWNGADHISDEIAYRVTCGAWDRTSNSVTLQFPYQDTVAGAELHEPGNVRSLVVNFADIWEADWVVATSQQLRRDVEIARGRPTVGWYTYLSREGPIPEDLPAEVQSGPHGGHVIVVPGASWDDITPDVVKPVAQALDDVGALGPTR